MAHTNAVETRQNVIRSIHKLRDSSLRDQTPQLSSHTLAVSSRKHTSSATLEGRTPDDPSSHEHGHHSEFEEQLAITERHAHKSDDADQNQVHSEGNGYDLPIPASAQSVEQYPSSAPSLGAGQQLEQPTDSSLPPTDAPGFDLEDGTMVEPAEHEMDIACATPITSHDGNVSQQDPSKRPRRPHRHSAPLEMRSYITPQSMERRRSGEAYVQNRLASEFRIPFGPSRKLPTEASSANETLRLETVGSNEHLRSDMLISSDPTYVGNEDANVDRASSYC